jgi:hypothetical protein
MKFPRGISNGVLKLFPPNGPDLNTRLLGYLIFLRPLVLLFVDLTTLGLGLSLLPYNIDKSELEQLCLIRLDVLKPFLFKS